MICPKCGKKSPEGETFCKHCGTRVKEHIHVLTTKSLPTTKNKRIGLILMLVGLLVVVLCALSLARVI